MICNSGILDMACTFNRNLFFRSWFLWLFTKNRFDKTFDNILLFLSSFYFLKVLLFLFLLDFLWLVISHSCHVYNITESNSLLITKRINFISILVLIFILNIIIHLINNSINQSSESSKLLKSHILCQKRYFLRFV